MPIRSSDGEIIGVAQAINKIPEGAPFTEDDEKVSFHAFVTCTLLLDNRLLFSLKRTGLA